MVQSTSHLDIFLAAPLNTGRPSTPGTKSTLSSSTAPLYSPPVLLTDVSSRITSKILAEGHEDVSGEGADDPVGKLIQERLTSTPTCGRRADEIMGAIVARGWITAPRIELFKNCCESPSPAAVSWLGVLDNTLRIATEREDIVARLTRKGASYGLDLSQELNGSMLRLDREGSALFEEAVRKTEALLHSFEGPSCHELARDLLTVCIKPGDKSIKPEAVNDFLTQGRRVSRLSTDQFSPKLVFDTAIEQGWMQVSETALVKRFLLKKGDSAWPIMHALKALRLELNHRSQILQDLEKRGIQIPESINILKDVVSRAATVQFVRLVNDLKNS